MDATTTQIITDALTAITRNIEESRKLDEELANQIIALKERVTLLEASQRNDREAIACLERGEKCVPRIWQSFPANNGGDHAN